MDYASLVESLVESLLNQKGYDTLYRNERFAGVEVDRVFLSPQHQWIVCEIKSLSHWNLLPARVHYTQKRRLQRAQVWLQAYKTPKVVRLYFAYYHYKTGVLRVYDEEEDEVEVIVGKRHTP